MTSAPSVAHPWSRPPRVRALSSYHREPVSYYFPTLYSLAELIEGAGPPPSVRELQEAARLSSLSVVTYHVGRLVDAGLVNTVPNVARSTSITAAGWRALDRPMPGSPARSLEAAVEEAVADLRAALGASPIRPSIRSVATRLEFALEFARDAHD